MTNDIVLQLLQSAVGGNNITKDDFALMYEAAEEIKRLRANVADLEKRVDRWEPKIHQGSSGSVYYTVND